MINLTNEEFAEVIGEVYKEVNKENADAAFFVVLVGAMIGASAEEKTEKKKAEKEAENEELEAFVEYNVGNRNISIFTKSDDKVRLVIKCNGIVAVDRTLDSLYKAYNYAFNIISR